jgi:hypothetical protein
MSAQTTQDTQTAAAEVTGVADGRRWWALVAVSLATFMTYLDIKGTCVKVGEELTSRA